MNQDNSNRTGPLLGHSILITSGPTRAPIDSVRYIGNRSSGRLGTAIALACCQAGASVTLLAGTGSVVPDIRTLSAIVDKESHCYESAGQPCSIAIARFDTFDELGQLLERQLEPKRYTVMIQAVAALDYIPETVHDGKISSDKYELLIRMVRAPKLIESIKKRDPGICLIGFKLETGIDDESLVKRAEDLHNRSGADLVVANRIEEVSATRHRASLVSWPGGKRSVVGPLDDRGAIAMGIVDWLQQNRPVKDLSVHET